MLRFDASVAKDLFCHLLAGVSDLPTHDFFYLSSQMQTEAELKWENSYFIITVWRELFLFFRQKNKQYKNIGREFCTKALLRIHLDMLWGCVVDEKKRAKRVTVQASDLIPRHYFDSIRFLHRKSQYFPDFRPAKHLIELWSAPYPLRSRQAKLLHVGNEYLSADQKAGLANRQYIW